LRAEQLVEVLPSVQTMLVLQKDLEVAAEVSGQPVAVEIMMAAGLKTSRTIALTQRRRKTNNQAWLEHDFPELEICLELEHAHC
jgi:hypothetical protein